MADNFVTIDTPNGPVDFPATMNKADIEAALRKMFPPPIDERSGAPAGIRAVVGAARTPQDALATLRKFYPDAKPYGDGNFVYTDPVSKQPKLYNEKNQTVFGVPVPSLGDLASIGGEVSEGVGAALGGTAGFLAGAPTVVGAPAGAVAGAGAGGVAGRELYDYLARNYLGTVDTRGVGQRARDVAIEATLNAAGQGTGMAISRAAPYVVAPAKRVVGGLLSNVGDTVTKAGERLGVRLPAGVATQSKGIQRVESGVAQTPGGAGPVTQAYEQFNADMANAAQRTAEKVATANGANPAGRVLTEKGSVGQFVQGAAKDAGQRFEQTRKTLDDAFTQLVPPNSRVPAANVQSSIAELEARVAQDPNSMGPILKPTIDLLKRVSADAEKNGGISFESLRKFRTNLGQAIERPDLSGYSAGDQQYLKEAYAALTKDMYAAAEATGPEALHALKLHDRYVRFNREVNLPMLQKIVDTDLDSQVYTYAMSGAKDGLGRLSTLKRNVKPEEWDTLAGSIFQKLGEAKPGARDAVSVSGGAYQFSPNTFVTEWNSLSTSAKKLLFGGTRYEKVVPQIDDLLKLANAGKDAAKTANVSNTAGAWTVASMLLGMGGAGGGVISNGLSGSLFDVSSAVGTLAGGTALANLSGRLLENPAFVRWATATAKAANTSPQSLPTQFARLYAIAKTEPEIRAVVDQYVQQAAPQFGIDPSEIKKPSK